MVDVPTTTVFDHVTSELGDRIAAVEQRVDALETTPPPPTDPELYVWTPTGPDGYDATGGYSRYTRDGLVEAYATKFVIDFDEWATGTIRVGEMHHTTQVRAVQMFGVVFPLNPGEFVEMPFSDATKIALMTAESSTDTNVPLFRVEADRNFTVRGETPDIVFPPPVPPDPEVPEEPLPELPPIEEQRPYDELPNRWIDNEFYYPSNPARIYPNIDLRGTDNVTLVRPRVAGPPSSSRYAGAIKMGHRSRITQGVFADSQRLVIEMPDEADGCIIDNSEFTRNRHNCIWAHAYHRNYGATIVQNRFVGNNSARESLNWDAADIKLLHILDAVVADNVHIGGWGDAIWYDSDAQGWILRNQIQGYAHGIYAEMCNKDLGATIIEDNDIDDCGWADPRGWVWGGAIVLSGSTGVQVRRNNVTNSRFHYVELAFNPADRRPHHGEDIVHATHGETHVELSGYNHIDTNGDPLHRGNYPEFHHPDTSTYVTPQLIDR